MIAKTDTFALVSVCVPAYNSEKYIVECLTSLTNQTYPNIEIIVVDDGSSDHTGELIGAFPGNQIQYYKIPNSGAATARNTAYSHAKGKFIVFFDADDYILPEFISNQMRILDGQSDIVVLSDWGRFYGDDLNTFQINSERFREMNFETWIRTYWYKCDPMTTPGRVLIPNSILKQSGLWDESLSLNDDLEFFTRVFMHCRKIVINGSAVFYYRSGVNGLSGKKTTEAYTSLVKSMLLSVGYVRQKYPGDKLIALSCSNMIQSCIYEIYPRESDLVQQATIALTEIGKSDFNFECGGLTKIMVGVFGWRLTKRIKYMLKLQS